MDGAAFFLALMGMLVIVAGFILANKIKNTIAAISEILASVIISFLFMVLLGRASSMTMNQSTLMGEYWAYMLIIFVPGYIIYNKFIRNKEGDKN